MNSETDLAICERIKLLRVVNDMTRPQFAEITKTGDKVEKKDVIYIKSIEQGRHSPSYDFLIKVKNRFDLSWNWLIEGIGDM